MTGFGLTMTDTSTQEARRKAMRCGNQYQRVTRCRSRFPQAVEASSFARYTWPSVAARAFGCVDVLSWDRRGDSAMFAFTRRALHGVGPLPAGDRRRQFTKTVVTRQHRSVLHSHPRTGCNRNARMQACSLNIYPGTNWHCTNLTRAPFCTNEAH